MFCGSRAIAFFRVNDPPVALHIDNRPIFGFGLEERFVQSVDVGVLIVVPFVPSIGVVDQQCESPAFSVGGSLEHLQIAVGIAEGCNRATPDV